jgi:hypothetical protein
MDLLRMDLGRPGQANNLVSFQTDFLSMLFITIFTIYSTDDLAPFIGLRPGQLPGWLAS